jgi:hypothetical protein
VKFNQEVEVAKGVFGRLFQMLLNEVYSIIGEQLAIVDGP